MRGQHIERWLSPRSAYPEGKTGYFAWRNSAKKRHAERLGQIMAASGYDEAAIARVGALVRKERLRTDREAQTLEDVACIVFLTHYLEEFLGKTDADDAKLARILAQTWNKMSPRGRGEAEKLELPAKALELLKRGREEMAAEEP